MGSGSSKGAGGFRVFRVFPEGPAAEAGLEVFFDYVVEVDGNVVESEQQSFFSMIKEQEGKRVKLTVYNSRTHNLREVHVIPRAWGGQGLLGLVVKFDYMQEGEEQGVRVLEVQKDSPAFAAGLIPYKDYIIGSGDIIVRNSDDFAEIIRASGGSAVTLTIYNSDVETVREVVLAPKPGWGGDGVLGCGIGTGLLHRIPMSRRHVVPQLNLAEDLPSELPLMTEEIVELSGPVTEPSPSQVVTDPSSPREPVASVKRGSSPRSPMRQPVEELPPTPPRSVEEPIEEVKDRPMSQESGVMVDPVPPVLVEPQLTQDRSPHVRPPSEESGYVVETFPQLGGSSPQSLDVSAAFVVDASPRVEPSTGSDERLAKLFD